MDTRVYPAVVKAIRNHSVQYFLSDYVVLAVEVYNITITITEQSANIGGHTLDRVGIARLVTSALRKAGIDYTMQGAWHPGNTGNPKIIVKW